MSEKDKKVVEYFREGKHKFCGKKLKEYDIRQRRIKKEVGDCSEIYVGQYKESDIMRDCGKQIRDMDLEGRFGGTQSAM